MHEGNSSFGSAEQSHTLLKKAELCDSQCLEGLISFRKEESQEHLKATKLQVTRTVVCQNAKHVCGRINLDQKRFSAECNFTPWTKLFSRRGQNEPRQRRGISSRFRARAPCTNPAPSRAFGSVRSSTLAVEPSQNFETILLALSSEISRNPQ